MRDKVESLRALAAEGSGATDAERDTAQRFLERLVAKRKHSVVDFVVDLSERMRRSVVVVYVGKCPRCSSETRVPMTSDDLRESPLGDYVLFQAYLSERSSHICTCPGRLVHVGMA